MAYVDGAKHDVFISYARVDNEEFQSGKEDSRWVSMICGNLRTMLNQRLGGTDSTDIYFDLASARGGNHVESELREAVSGSATFVMILTEGYINSEWCLKECQYFVESKEDLSGRIYILNCDNIDYNHPKLPEQLRNMISYTFWQKQTDSAVLEPLGFPAPLNELKEPAYFKAMNKIRSELAQFLQTEKNGGRETGWDNSAPGQSHSGSDSSNDAPPLSVFLARTSLDMYDTREEVESYLKQSGWEVLPKTQYPDNPKDYREALQADLDSSLLFVQILDALPTSYEKLEDEVVQKHSVETLQWRSTALDLNDLSPERRQFLERGFGGSSKGVISCNLQDFKMQINELATRNKIRASRPVKNEALSGGDILVKTENCNEETAFEIAKELDRFGFGYEINDEDESMAEAVGNLDYDGVIIVYGKSNPRKVAKRVKECRSTVLSGKPLPKFGIFLGPPKQKEPLKIKPSGFIVLDDEPIDLNNSAQPLSRFVEEITKTASAI